MIYLLRKCSRIIPFIGALAFCTVTFGQADLVTVDSTNFIKGIVRDAKTKAPVVAAQIQSLNNEEAATTNDEGKFTIKVMSTNEVLLVKAFDYNQREIPVRTKDNLVIDLYSDVFTDIYPELMNVSGTLRSSFHTNAAIGISDMGNPSSVSVDEAIQLRLGGDVRTINKSGVNGFGSSLFIRGLNSVNLNAQPLFVVDGVIWNTFNNVASLHGGFMINSLADIDLNDIESVSVIKDGTSIYGSKGGNGVVIIKTKRGEDMATKIEVNAVGGIIDMPVSLPVMNGDQFRIYSTDLYATIENPLYTYDELNYLQDDPTLIDYKTYHNNTNWDKEVYQKGTSQSYNISVNGGDERALYAFSMGYTGNNGVVKNTDMQRLNTRFNADFSMSDRIKTALDIGFTNIDRNLLDDGVNYYTSPTYQAMIKADFFSPYSYTSSGTLTTDVVDSDDFGVGNPVAIIQNALNTNKHYRLNLGIKPEFQLGKSLWLSSRFDYSLDKVKETFYSPIIGVNQRYMTGLGYSENVFKNQQMRNTALFDDTQLHYKNKFGSNHYVNAIAGWRYLLNTYELDYAEGHNSGSDQKRNLLNEEVFKSTLGANDQTKSISNYANVDYSFDNRYFLTASVAVDGSSRFGSETVGGVQLFDHSWGVFPSVQGAWLITSERFMDKASVINRLSLRGGYGMSGNDAFNPYANSAYFIPVKYMDRANGLILGNIGNNEIQWETTKKINIGVDANLLNDRLSLSVDVYNNKTTDLLTMQELPEVAGAGYYWKNGGEMSNKGYEISTTIKMANTRTVKWELSGNIGHYKNNIESLPDGRITTNAYGAEILTDVGNAAGVFYGYKTVGVFTTEVHALAANLMMVDEDGLEHYFGAGDMYFEDKVADGIIDENDKQIIGDPNPDFYGSFNNKIVLGNFTFNAFFTFSYGNDVYNYLRYTLESGSGFRNQTTAMLNHWTYEGQETNIPKVSYQDPMGNSRFSDRWIEDGSYLRLKSVSVNYKVPLRNGFVKGLNIWASANNLLTLTNYLGRDPEVSSHNAVLFQGIDMGLIPACKSYYVGIKLNL